MLYNVLASPDVDWQAIIVGGFGFGAIIPTAIWILKWAAKRQDEVVQAAIKGEALRTDQLIGFMERQHTDLKEDRRLMRETIDKNTAAIVDNSRAIQRIADSVEASTKHG
jgi:hypothetical protein